MSSLARNPWPFSDPENVAVITTSDVIRDREPIVRVTHDEDDGGWQFLSTSGASSEFAMLVGLREVYDIDPSIGALADLPRGWRALRKDAGSPWVRERQPPHEPGED